MYVCVNVMLGHCFDGNHRPGLTPAYGLRRAKVGFGTDGVFLYVRLYGGDVVALFLEEREKPARYCAYAEPEVVLRSR